MKNEKIREFLTRLAQEEGFKDEFLKLKEKVEKNGFSKELNKQLISDHFLPWSKKLGYKLTKEDFIDFERTQKLPQITGLSLEQLENVSGGFGFPMLLSLFATFGSLIFGVGNGSTGNNTNANNDPVGTGLTSYSQTGAANQDYYNYHYGTTPADFDADTTAGGPMSTALVTTPGQPQTSVSDYNEHFARSSAAVDSGENVIQMLKDIHGADYEQNYGDTSVDDYDLYQASTSVADYEQNYAKSPSPENSPFSARKDKLYKELKIIDDNYRFLEERGDDRTDFEEISKYRNIIQNSETDSDLDWADHNIGVDLANTGAFLKDKLGEASYDKEIELEQLIDDTWPTIYANSIASSLIDEVQTLYGKPHNPKTVDDFIRAEEEWKQLEDKIHRAIEDYKSGESPLPEDSPLSARKNNMYKRAKEIENKLRLLEKRTGRSTSRLIKELHEGIDDIQIAESERQLDSVDKYLSSNFPHEQFNDL